MDNLKHELGVSKLVTVLGYAAEMDRQKWNLFFPYRKIRGKINQFVTTISNHYRNNNHFGFIIGRDLAGVMAFFNFYALNYGLKRCFIAPEGSSVGNSVPRNAGTFFRPHTVLNMSWLLSLNSKELIPQYAITSDNKMVKITFDDNKSSNKDVRWGSECPFLFAQADACIFFGGGKIALNEEIPLAIEKAEENPNFKIVIVKECGGVSDVKIPSLDKFISRNQVCYAKDGIEAAQYLISNL